MANIPVKRSLDFGGVSRIIGLPDGTDPQHPATVAQLNAQRNGLSWKVAVKVATQANIDLSAPGASIDSVSLSAGDRVLVKAQTAGEENGIYDWHGASSALTRSADAATAPELVEAVVTVIGGTSAGVSYRQSVTAITLDTTALVWALFGSAAPSASTTIEGMVTLATQGEVNTGTGDKVVTAGTLAGSNYVAKRYAASIGNGTDAAIVVTHNLSTRDINVSVRLNASPYTFVEVQVDATTTNTATITFDTGNEPTTDEYRIIILA